MIYVATAQFNDETITIYNDGDTVDDALNNYINDGLCEHVEDVFHQGIELESLEIKVYTQREPQDDDCMGHEWYLGEHCKSVTHDVAAIVKELHELYDDLEVA